MKAEAERMKTEAGELRVRKGTIASRAAQARAGGGGSEQLGSKGGSSAFDNFRRMEEKIEGREAEGRAMVEVDEALGKGPRAEDLEAKFRDLERQAGGGAARSTDVDDELTAL